MLSFVSPKLKELSEEIGPDRLKKEGFPRPDKVLIMQGVDGDGEDAYYVYLFFPARTPDAALDWKKIQPMVSWIWRQVWDNTGQNYWPYVKVLRGRELVA